MLYNNLNLLCLNFAPNSNEWWNPSYETIYCTETGTVASDRFTVLDISCAKSDYKTEEIAKTLLKGQFLLDAKFIKRFFPKADSEFYWGITKANEETAEVSFFYEIDRSFEKTGTLEVPIRKEEPPKYQEVLNRFEPAKGEISFDYDSEQIAKIYSVFEALNKTIPDEHKKAKLSFSERGNLFFNFDYGKQTGRGIVAYTK